MEKQQLMSVWGSNLRELREKLGYRTQGDLAEAMTQAGYTINQSNVSRAESGTLEKPQTDIYEFLRDRHGVTHDQVFAVPVDWRKKYYDLLETIQGQAPGNRVNQLEDLVKDLKQEIEQMRGLIEDTTEKED